MFSAINIESRIAIVTAMTFYWPLDIGYSYPLIPGTRKLTEQRRGQASKVAPIEEDYDDICMKEKECHPCQPVLTSTKDSPQQTKVAGKQIYSAVVKKSKKKLNTDKN